MKKVTQALAKEFDKMPARCIRIVLEDLVALDKYVPRGTDKKKNCPPMATSKSMEIKSFAMLLSVLELAEVWELKDALIEAILNGTLDGGHKTHDKMHLTKTNSVY